MLKFYDVDKNYIAFLKKYDKQVPNVEYDTNNKFICGVVYQINDVKYYVPISHSTQKQQTNLQIFDNNKPISTIKFSFMIPAFDEVLTVKNFKEIRKIDPNYANILAAEYSYCSNHITDIQRKANSVYKIGCNKNHKLNYACCDFKKLEEVYLSYNSLLQAAPTEEQN